MLYLFISHHSHRTEKRKRRSIIREEVIGEDDQLFGTVKIDVQVREEIYPNTYWARHHGNTRAIVP